MLDLLLKLVDRLIDLVKQRETQDRKCFDDFVKPAWDDFQVVHRNYLESFRSYRDILVQSDHPVLPDHPFWTSISQDSLFSSDIRERLHALSQYNSDPILGSLITRIHEYLTLASLTKPSDAVKVALTGSPEDILRSEMQRNVPRYWAVNEIKAAQEQQHENAAEYKRVAISKIDGVVAALNQHFARVCEEFESVKARLLR